MLSAYVSGVRETVLVAALASLLAACGGDDDGGDATASGGSTSSGGTSSTGGSSPGTGGTPGTSTVSYSSDVRPIFTAKCNYCHGPTSAVMVDLNDPFDPKLGIIGRANSWTGSEEKLLVDPGNVANSFLITKVVETDLDAHVDGAPMPMELPMLTSEEIAAVEQWISAGAENDDFFKAQVAPIFGTAVSLGRAAGKCTYCHFPGNTHTVDVLDVFGTMVDKRSAYGSNGSPGTIVIPGDPENSVLIKKLKGDPSVGFQMPFVPPRVTADEVETLKVWIEEGAQDN
jgi:hypothetical protein